jgi:hypothetical protein
LRSGLLREIEELTLNQTIEEFEMIGTVNYERRRQVPTPRQFGGLPFEFVAFTATDGDSNLDSAARRLHQRRKLSDGLRRGDADDTACGEEGERRQIEQAGQQYADRSAGPAGSVAIMAAKCPPAE